MTEHARLSPSASDRWMACAASVQMTEDIIEAKESEAAAEGNRAHTLLEEALKIWIATGDDVVICEDDEMREYIQDVLYYVIERYETMPGGERVIEVETKVNLHYMTGRTDLWGKADIIIWNDTHIDVLDLKYGKGLFVPTDTSQNRIYILGVMSKFMKASKGQVPWESVRGTIMQPRYPDSNGKTIRFLDFDPNELVEWKDTVLLPAAVATDRPGGPIAGKKQCQWCVAKPTCPAVEAKVKDLCSVFEPVFTEISPGTVITHEVPADPDLLDIDKLLEVHDNIPFIEGYLKAVAKKIREMLEARDERLKGILKLVRSRQQNKWSLEDDELAIELMKGTGRMLKADLFKSVVISAPQALKLKTLKPAQKKKLQSFIVKSEGSLSIVPDSDPRTNAFPVLVFEDKSAPGGGSDEGFDFL